MNVVWRRVTVVKRHAGLGIEVEGETDVDGRAVVESWWRWDGHGGFGKVWRMMSPAVIGCSSTAACSSHLRNGSSWTRITLL